MQLKSKTQRKGKTVYDQRMALKKAMGGRCERCGSTNQLEFHDRLERGDEHHALGSAGRYRWYRAEWNHGHIELVCAICHRRITLNARLKKERQDTERIAIAKGVPFNLKAACAELWPDLQAPPSALGKNPPPLT